MDTRTKQLQKVLKSKNIDSFIVTNPINIFYLTGFQGFSKTDREAILALTPKALPAGRQAIFITARIYSKEARKIAKKGFETRIVGERHLMFEEVKKLFKSAKYVGFEENDLKYGEFNNLSKSLKSLIPTKDIIENLRIIKSADEIKKIEKAQIISQKAFEVLIKTIKIGQTEEEIAHNLSSIIQSLGKHGLSFESIVASGPNSGIPHHTPGNRKLKKGDMLLLDFGAKYKSYHGDLSRTVFLGKAEDSHKNIYHHVRSAQKKALDKITFGTKTSSAYHLANDYFKKHKLDNYFLHGLGHGIGLEVHESPILRQSTDITLSENMVFSVEPGLYFPWGGIRIEDLAVIKNGKPKVLGLVVDELIELDI